MKPEDLKEHPEGGRFKEVFRSGETVKTSSGKERNALTHIYFNLKSGEVSKFHKVTSDEVWNLYKGALKLYLWNGTEVKCIQLSEKESHFCYVVPAGWWQAAEPVSESVLVGCSVGPGFEFEDFQLISKDSNEADLLRALPKDYQRFI